MSAAPSLSVVIPTRNRRRSLERLFGALEAQTLEPDRYEAVVANDGSMDGTREMLQRAALGFPVRVVESGGQGRAAACNAASRAATGRFLLFLDDDMEPRPGLLAAHLAAHESGFRRGVVGAVPVRVEPSSPAVVAYVGEKFNRHLERLARPGHRMTFRDFYSGNFSISRSLFFEVGGFDEDFRMYGNEDGELALRLLRSGVELYYSPEAAAEQHYEKDLAALARDSEAKGRTAVLLSRKWPGTLSELRFAQSWKDSWKWRGPRAALLAVSHVLPIAPELVLFAVRRLERAAPGRRESAYRLALDFFYHLGARQALAEGEPAAMALAGNAGSSGRS